MRILIIDDELAMCEIMVEFLSSYGQCDCAFDAEEAIKLFTEAYGEGKTYGLVFLNITMPGLSGQEILERLRAYEKSLHLEMHQYATVFMALALDAIGNQVDSYKQKADAYFVKPIDFDRLQAELDTFGISMAS